MICEVGDKWYDLGIQLLKPDQVSYLRTIQTDFRNDVKKCCTEMFTYWLRSHPEANWGHLVKALKLPSVELNYLAESIQQRFSGKYTYVCIFCYNMLCIYNIIVIGIV